MTPPAATVTARPRTARPTSPRAPRRVSGPARTPAGRGSVVTPQGAVLAPPLGLRLAQRATTLPDHRLLDRLVRGRLWIAVLATGLVGIVFLQISLLKLNTGISRAVQTAQTLERQNTAMTMEISRAGGGQRVQEAAAARGLLTPASGEPRFLDAGKASPARAAANITAPAPIQQLPLGMIPPSRGGTAGVVAAAAAPGLAGAATGAATTSPPAATPLPAATTAVASPPAATVATPPPAAAAVAPPPPAETTVASPPAATTVATPPPAQVAAASAVGGASAGAQG